MSGEAIPFIAPDYEDVSEQDWQEERDRKRKNLSRDAIREMVNEAMADDELCDLFHRLVIMRAPKAPEHLATGTALNERITAAVEEYLDAVD